MRILTEMENQFVILIAPKWIQIKNRENGKVQYGKTHDECEGCGCYDLGLCIGSLFWSRFIDCEIYRPQPVFVQSSGRASVERGVQHRVAVQGQGVVSVTKSA